MPRFIFVFISERKNNMTSNQERKRILVTGGTGLVGSAIQYVVQNESDREKHNEEYYFISSKECDLRLKNK